MKSICTRQDDLTARKHNVVDEIDIMKLKTALAGLDKQTSRRRREIYNKIVLEANYKIIDRDGLTFTDTLLLIAHNKLIDEGKALS